MTLTTIIGVGGHSLLLTAIILRMTHDLKLRMSHRYILAIVILALTLIPIGPLSATQFSRGLFGDLSITTLVILGRFLLLPQASRAESRQLFTLVCMIGILFYPAALGLGMIDPYQWGYLNSYRGVEVPMIFLACLIVLIIFAGQIKNSLVILCITMALGGFLLGAMESRNMWDYLIDPMIFIYSLVSLGIYLIKLILVTYSAKKRIST